MASQSVIQVLINVKDNASKGIRSVGKSIDQMGGRFDQVKKKAGFALAAIGKSLVTIGKFGLVGVAGLAAFAVKTGFAASRVRELEFALGAIAKANGISQKAIDKTVASLKDANIARDKALQITSLFIQSELDLADATKLAAVAKDLAVLSQQDSSEALIDLTRAIAVQRPMLLRQFGIVQGLDEIYGNYAKTVGKTAVTLTQAEKKQAFLNTILTQGKKVAGAYDAAMGAVGKRFRSLKGRIIPDFSAAIGKAFEPILVVVIDGVTSAIKDMSVWLEENKDTVARWGQIAGDVTKKVVEGFGKVVNFLVNNKEVVVGILGAFVIGIIALGVAFLISHAIIIGVFVAIAVAITILTKIWNSNWGGIQEKTKAVLDFLLNKLVPGIKKTVQFVINRINWLKDNWVFAVGFIIGFMANLPFNIARALWNNRSKIINIIKSIGKAMLNAFMNGVKALVEEAKRLPGKLFNAAKAAPGKAADFFKGFFKGAGLPGFAHGTDFSPSGPAIVGERGPEIVDLPGGSKVTPITGGGDTFNITLNIGTLVDSDSTRRNFAERLMQDIENIATMKGKKANLIT